jgi:uncharacterized protein
MTPNTRDFAFELKSINADGTFEGYGSVFGVKDSYDEIVAPGAFADTLNTHRSNGTMPALLWQHRSGEPIGVYTSMSEDQIGLKLQGRLALKTQRGAEAYELLKMKAISGLSIGFQTREDSFDRLTGIRTLKRVDLWETSLVTFPANDSARVQGVKSGLTIRDAEKALREVGFSQSDAKAIVASGFKTLSQREVDGGGDVQQLITNLQRVAGIKR